MVTHKTRAGPVQVLDSVGKVFPLFDSSDTNARDVPMILGLGLASKLLFFLAVALRSTASSVRPPRAGD